MLAKTTSASTAPAGPVTQPSQIHTMPRLSNKQTVRLTVSEMKSNPQCRGQRRSRYKTTSLRFIGSRALFISRDKRVMSFDERTQIFHIIPDNKSSRPQLRSRRTGCGEPRGGSPRCAPFSSTRRDHRCRWCWAAACCRHASGCRTLSSSLKVGSQ